MQFRHDRLNNHDFLEPESDMYFLLDNTIHTDVATNVVVDYREFHNFFYSLEYIHKDKEERIPRFVQTKKESKVAQDDMFYIADLAASAVAKLADSNMLRSNLIEQALAFCEQVLTRKGYQQIISQELVDLDTEEKRCLMLVAGSQNRDMLKQRCRKAAETCIRIQRQFDVIFSGGNPPNGQEHKPVRILSEARELQKWFERYIQELAPRQTRINYRGYLEDTAQNTVENIENLFELGFINETESYILYAVSSSYHLLRIADAIWINMQRHNQKKILKLVLIGAEKGFHPETIAHSSSYVKELMFEVYRNLLSAELGIPLVLE